jgi:hypothetical protein
MRLVFQTLGYTPDLDCDAYRYATEVAELLVAGLNVGWRNRARKLEEGAPAKA